MFATVLMMVCTIFFADFISGDDDEDSGLDELHNWDLHCKFQPNSFDCDGKGRNTERFYYDILMGDCKTFTSGKCSRNYNSFSTLKKCQASCRDAGLRTLSRNLTASSFCRLQPDFGWCHEYHPRWYFDITERTCKGFSFSGCGGNMNSFESAQTCAGYCAQAVKYN